MAVTPHFFLKDQLQWTEVSYHLLHDYGTVAELCAHRKSKSATYFLGLDGSSGPSQSTISTLVFGFAVPSDAPDDRQLSERSCDTKLSFGSALVASELRREVDAFSLYRVWSDMKRYFF